MRMIGMVIAFLLAATVAMAQDYTVKNTSDGYLNLRSGPGTSYDIQQRLYPGMTVRWIGERGNWYRVRLQDGRTGWASKNFLDRAKTMRGNVKYVQPTSDGFLNLRQGPATKYRIKGELYTGEEVSVIGRSGNWTKVRSRKFGLGWVYSKYIGYDPVY